MTQKKKVLSISLLILFLCPYFYAETSTTTSKKSEAWIISAIRFDFINSVLSDETALAVSQNIPKLILEQIAAGSQRVLPVRETLNRQRNELKTQRLALFLELSKATKTRDALILQDISPNKLRKAIEAQDKVIEEIHKKISDNLMENESLSDDSIELVFQEDSIFLAPPPEPKKNKRKNPEYRNNFEPIALYKNSSDLFVPPDGIESDNYTNYAYENAVNTAKIRGLICGSITSYGGYAAVTAELRLFPGGSLAATITEVGLLANPTQIARNLSRALMPYITNNPPTTLKITVNPPEASQHTLFSLDGNVFNSLPSQVVTDRAIHEITFEAEGYRRANITYAFTDNDSYEVEVLLVKEDLSTLNLHFNDPIMAVLSTDAVNAYQLTPEIQTTTIKVDGKPIIGSIFNEDGNQSFFYISEAQVKKGNDYDVFLTDYDVSADIEKHRRRMYTAYSALILSLPFTFYNYGTYVNKLNGNANLLVDSDEVETWRQRSLVCVGISATLGVVFGYQLIRYLISTNAALPKNVEPTRNKK